MRIAALLLLACLLQASDKPPRDWKDGVVIGIDSGFVPTGTRERGSVDTDGRYSGSSQVQGYRAVNFVIRGADGIIYRLEPNAKGNATYMIPWYGVIAAAKDAHRRGQPQIAIGNSIKFDILNTRGWMLDSAGKEFEVRMISATLPDSSLPQGRQNPTERPLTQSDRDDTASKSFPVSSPKTVEPIRQAEQSGKSIDLSPQNGNKWKVMKDLDKSIALWHNEKPSSQVQKEVIREMDRFYADPANLNIPVSDAFANLFPSLANSARR